jgi:hypothetical protein
MTDLHKHLYAPFIEYQGTGILECDGYPATDAKFAVGQFPDGDIEIAAISTLPMIIQAGYDGLQMPQRAKITGETSQGFHLTAEGACSTTFSFSQEGDTSTSYIDPEFFEITNRDVLPPKLIRFGLTSFQFDDILGFGVDRNEIHIQYRGLEIRVIPSLYYGRSKELPKGKKYSDMTAIAEIRLNAAQQIAEFQDVMGTLCRLFSIAQGTIINWIFYVILSEDQQLAKAFHRQTIVRPPSNLSIISCKDIQDFMNISVQGYDNAVQKQLIDSTCISSYLDAFVEKINIRTRAISLVVSIERLVHLYKHSAVRYSYGEDNSSFRKALNSMCLRYGLDTNELSNLIGHRNSLVHEAIFKDIANTQSVDQDTIEAYGILKSFTSRLILATLQYHGNYFEWLDVPPKLKRVS